MAAPSTLSASLYVAAGGGVGAWLRFMAGRALGPVSLTFPVATLAINLAGSFAMGLLAAWLVRNGGGESTRLLIGVGLLGGFTTFSAFNLELVGLAQRGALGLALLYALASVIGGALALVLGLKVFA